MWKQVLDDVIRKTLAGFEERLTAFGPRLLAMLVVLAVGAAVAVTLRLLLRTLLPRLGFDRFAARTGLYEMLGRGGIRKPASAVLAKVLSWATLAVFVLLAIGALDLQIAMDLVSRAFSYLPQLLIASALLLMGGLVAAFVRRSVLIAAVNAGVPSARLLAGGARTGLMILFARHGPRAPRRGAAGVARVLHDPLRRPRVRAVVGLWSGRAPPCPRDPGASRPPVVGAAGRRTGTSAHLWSARAPSRSRCRGFGFWLAEVEFWPPRRPARALPVFARPVIASRAVVSPDSRDARPGERPGRSGNWGTALREAAPYISIGSTLAITVLLGLGVGYWLDRRLKTDPWFLLAGGVLGMARRCTSSSKRWRDSESDLQQVRSLRPHGRRPSDRPSCFPFFPRRRGRRWLSAPSSPR